MKLKIKNTLTRLLLAITFIIISNAELNAQRRADFHYIYDRRQQNHPFYVQPAPPQWTPPSATAGFHHNRNYDHPISSPNNAQKHVARVASFDTSCESYNQKKPSFDSLLAEVNQRAQGGTYSNQDYLNLNNAYNELLSLFQIIKAQAPTVGLDPTTLPSFAATQQSLDASKSDIENWHRRAHASFEDHCTLYNQKKPEFDSLLAEVNQRAQDRFYANEDWQNLNNAYNELLSLFQSITTQAPILGLDPTTLPSFAATQQSLETAWSNIEELKQSYEDSQYGEILHFEADTPLLAQELNNFNAIFNGLEAPDMESFNNLMSTFLGKGGSSESEASISSLPFDPSMAGDYVLSSFKYQDDKAGVFMEIARVMKAGDYEMGSTWNDLPEDSLILRGIKVSQENSDVTFALSGQGERVFLKTDVSSMNNYVIQKNIEGYVFFDPTWANMPKVDPATLSTWGLKDAASAFGREFLSALVDFIPYIGSSKTLTELLYGTDPITGQPVPYIVSVFAIAGSVAPVPGVKNVAKFVGNGVVISAKMLDKGALALEKSITRLVKSLPGEAPDIMKKFWLKNKTTKAKSAGGVLEDNVCPREFGLVDNLGKKIDTSVKLEFNQKFTDISHLPPLRQEYIREVWGLEETVYKLFNEDKTIEEVARTVSQMRRDIGVKYKDLTPPEFREMYYQANIKTYDDPLGPTIEYFRNKGKSWEEIIESACRVHGRDLPGTK